MDLKLIQHANQVLRTLIAPLADCCSLPELNDCVGEIVLNLGLDTYAYCGVLSTSQPLVTSILKKIRTPNVLHDGFYVCILSNFPSHFLDRYFTERWFLVDPVVNTTFVENRPIAYSQQKSLKFSQMKVLPSHEAMLTYYERFHQELPKRGVTFPVRSPGGIGFLNLSASGMGVSSMQRLSHLDQLGCVLASEIQKRAFELYVDQLHPTSEHLTSRESECLLMVGQHLQAKEIAYELGLSIHTVREYLNEAKRKLGASTPQLAFQTAYLKNILI